MGKITKRGDSYLRTLLIHGGRAVLRAASLRRRTGQPLDGLQAWALDLQQRQGHNKAAVALANKLARRLWALDHHGTAFNPHHQPAAARGLTSPPHVNGTLPGVPHDLDHDEGFGPRAGQGR